MTDISSLTAHNRQLLQEVKRRTDQMAAINVVTTVIGQSLDLDSTLTTALEVTQTIVDADASGISLIDAEAGELVLRAQRGWVHDFVVSNPMRIPLGEGMSGEVIRRDDVVVYNNLTGREEYAIPRFRDERFQAIAMAPMHARGRIIGILSIMSNEADRFNDDVIDVLRVVADTVGVALENARLFAESNAGRERMEAVLHSTTDGIIATDPQGRVSLVNHAAERLLRVAQSALIGVSLPDAPINAHIREQLLKALAARQRGENKALQATLEDNRVIAVVVNPVLSDGQYEQAAWDGWVIALQDVTHLRRAEIARAQFMQAAAHDMRNPLSIAYSSIITLDKLIKERDVAVDEVIALAMGGMERLQTIIDDLLRLEHIETGYNFRVQEFNLLDVLHEIERESDRYLSEKAIRLNRAIQPEIPTLHADVRWFKQALHNYLGNAAKYTAEGGQITLRVRTVDDWLTVEVIDEGPGVPVNAQARIFDRFYRVHGDKFEGSGLGLAIVKSIAEAHGGEVYLRSERQRGSTFGFRIPINPPEEIKRDIQLPEDEDKPPAQKFF